MSSNVEERLLNRIDRLEAENHSLRLLIQEIENLARADPFDSAVAAVMLYTIKKRRASDEAGVSNE